MPTSVWAARPERTDRVVRAGRWLLVALLAETAVGVVLGAPGATGYQLVVIAYPLTALVVWRAVAGLPLRGLFVGCAPRWVVIATAAPLVVQAAALLVLAVTGGLVRGAATPIGSTVLSVIVVALLFTALPEELVFRGALLRLVTPASGWPVALTTTSVLFALAHLPRVLSQGEGLDPLYLLGLVVFAISLAVLARSAGSIWPAVAWHAASNAGALLLEGVGLEPAGPVWLTDGSWSSGVLDLLTTLVGAAVAMMLARSVRGARRGRDL